MKATARSAREFLNADESRVKAMVLASSESLLTPMYLLALNVSEHIDMTFVVEDAQGMFGQLSSQRVVKSLPCMLVFKEMRNTPATTLQGKDLTPHRALTLLRSHKRMLVPHLTSAEVFEEACLLLPVRPAHCLLLFRSGSGRFQPQTLADQLRMLLIEAFMKDKSLVETAFTANAFAQPELSRAVGLPYQTSGPNTLSLCLLKLTDDGMQHALYPMLLNGTATGEEAQTDLAQITRWLTQRSHEYAVTGRFVIMEEYEPLRARLYQHIIELYFETQEMLRHMNSFVVFLIFLVLLMAGLALIERAVETTLPTDNTEVVNTSNGTPRASARGRQSPVIASDPVPPLSKEIDLNISRTESQVLRRRGPQSPHRMKVLRRVSDPHQSRSMPSSPYRQHYSAEYSTTNLRDVKKHLSFD